MQYLAVFKRTFFGSVLYISDIFGELEVLFAFLEIANVALGKNTTQSSTELGGHSRHAVDGNNASNWEKGSCTHTRKTNSSWWRVDLGKEVWSLKITWMKDDILIN